MGNLGQKFARLKDSNFVRNVATVATGIAAAQVISLAFMPFLARLYGPEAFGALAAFSAVVNIITPLATLGYANAIVIPEAEEDATAVARLALVCASFISLLSFILILSIQSELAAWSGLEATSTLLYLIPASLLMGALLSVANQVAIREGLFRGKATSHVASTFLMNAGKLTGGLFAPSGLTLIVIALVGNVLNYFLLLKFVPRKGTFLVKRWFGVAGIFEAARAQRDFALYKMPQGVINAAAVGLPVILLSAFSGPTAAGAYSVTVLVLGAPVVLLGQSVGEVFYPKITAAIQRRSSNAYALMIKTTLALGGLAAIPFAVVMLFGPDLFVFALGEKWRQAGEYARWVAPWLWCVLSTRAIVAAFPILRLQPYLLFQEVLSVISRSFALFAGLHFWNSDLLAIALFSIAGIALMAVLAGVGLWSFKREVGTWPSDSKFTTSVP